MNIFIHCIHSFIQNISKEKKMEIERVLDLVFDRVVADSIVNNGDLDIKVDKAVEDIDELLLGMWMMTIKVNENEKEASARVVAAASGGSNSASHSQKQSIYATQKQQEKKEIIKDLSEFVMDVMLDHGEKSKIERAFAKNIKHRGLKASKDVLIGTVLK